MKEQNVIDELPLVTYEFKEVKRQEFYTMIKRHVMAYCGEDNKEFPSQYNWIFDFVIEVNHTHFGGNKISILVSPNYSERDETSNLYGLIKSFISMYNFFKNDLKFRAIEEVKRFIDEDIKKYEHQYNNMIREVSDKINYKSKLSTEFNERLESDEKFEKDFLNNYESFEDLLEQTFNSIRATSYFRGEVWLRFYKELSERLFNAEPINTLPNSKPESNKPDVSDIGFNLGYSNEQLTALHTALMNDDFLEKESNSEHFKNAFNGKKLTNFEKLKWIDKTKKNHHISIHTVFQLLDSCKISLKGEYSIIPEVRKKIKQIFENDFGNIQSKYNEFTPLKTERHTLIDSIIKKL